MKKIRDFISYPLRLEMAPDVIYRLRSVVVHWGSLEHGHYIAVVGKNINTVPQQKNANPPSQP
jgi:ubiquitin C-terminal hydrolase